MLTLEEIYKIEKYCTERMPVMDVPMTLMKAAKDLPLAIQSLREAYTRIADLEEALKDILHWQFILDRSNRTMKYARILTEIIDIARAALQTKETK